jgi:hypothetical protein
MNPIWFAITASLIGGGAVGAAITALVTKYRNKRQPVTFNRERIEVFKYNPDTPFLQAALTLTTEEVNGIHSSVPIKNLSIEQLTLVNTGNADISEFKFGITLQSDNEVIKVQPETSDRHHAVIMQQEVSLERPQNAVDFVLRPFNRGDEYKFTIHFIYGKSPRPIRLSSPHSTKLIEAKERTGRGLLTTVFSHPSFVAIGIAAALTTAALGVFLGFKSESNDLLFGPSDFMRQEQDKKLQQQIDDLNKKLNEMLEKNDKNPNPTPTPSGV